MMNNWLLISIFCLFLSNQTSAQQSNINLLEWIGGPQAIMIRAESPEIVWDAFAEWEINKNADFRAVTDYLSSDRFLNLLTKSGIKPDLKAENLDLDFATRIFSGPITFVLDAKQTDHWWVAFETSGETIDDFVETLSKMIGIETDVLTKDYLILDVVTYEEVGVHEMAGSKAHFFQYGNQIFICSDKNSATALIDRFTSNQQPKYPFSSSRKLLLSMKRSTRLKNHTPVLQVYFDPSLARSFFPQIPAAVWRAAGLHDITGSLLEISVPDRVDFEDGIKPQFAIDAWIAITYPRPPIWNAVLASPRIDEVPDFVNLEDSDVSEIQLLSVDVDKIFKATTDVFNEYFGEQSFEKSIAQLESKERVGQGFIKQIANAWNGKFCMVSFGSSPTKRTTPMAFFGVRDVEDSIQTINTLLPKYAKNQSVLPDYTETNESHFWTWSRTAMEKHRAAMKKLVPAGFKLDSSRIGLDGFALNNDWVLMSRNQRIAKKPLIDTVKIDEVEPLQAMLRHIDQSSSNVAERAIGIWALWPSYWKQQLAGLEFRHNVKRSGPVKSEKDFKELFSKMVPLEKLDSLEQVQDQIKIRIGWSLINSFGTNIVVVSPAKFGVRISAVAFANEKKEGSPTK